MSKNFVFLKNISYSKYNSNFRNHVASSKLISQDLQSPTSFALFLLHEVKSP